MLKTTVFGKQKDGKKAKMAAEFPILLPHLWIQAMQEAEMWDVLGGPDELHKFWNSQSVKNPRLEKCTRLTCKAVGIGRAMVFCHYACMEMQHHIQKWMD